MREKCLQLIANRSIVIHNVSDLVDQVDDVLCHDIGRSSLASENGHTRDDIVQVIGGHALQSEVAVDAARN